MDAKIVDYAIVNHRIDDEYFVKILTLIDVDTNNSDNRYFDYYDALDKTKCTNEKRKKEKKKIDSVFDYIGLSFFLSFLLNKYI
jgi:hypothetical protein